MAEKEAIVTAGGSGMGAAAARRLARDGYRIAILSWSGKGEVLALVEIQRDPLIAMIRQPAVELHCLLRQRQQPLLHA